MPFIYIIKNNINNKVYIGKTNRTIEKRWEEHKKDYRRELKEKRPLYSAMLFWGIENFLIEKIEECSLDEVCNKEKYWIKYYNSYENGYNATEGGDGKHCANYELIVKKYLELKSLKKVKEETKYDIKTIKLALELNNIPIFEKQKRKLICKNCGNEIDYRNKTNYCRKCYLKNQKIEVPLKEELKNKIRNQSFYSIAKEYNVGRATIFRWCDKYNLPSTKEKIKLISNEEWETI